MSLKRAPVTSQFRSGYHFVAKTIFSDGLLYVLSFVSRCIFVFSYVCRGGFLIPSHFSISALVAVFVSYYPYLL